MLNWESITRTRKMGGLGIRRLIAFNVGLLAKWWWRFGTEKQSLWFKVIKARYGYAENVWYPTQSTSTARSKVWEDISSLESNSREVDMVFKQGFVVKVGSGDQTSFWEDRWCNSRSLKEIYPRLYSLSNNKLSTVREMCCGLGEDRWALSFRRNLFVWEEDLVSHLYQLLEMVPIITNRNDELRWLWDSSGQFSVNSFYDKWETVAVPENPKSDLFKLVWRNVCPFRIEVFAWLAVQEKIATRDCLLRRGILINRDNGVCPFCNSEMENPNHLLLQCHFSWSIWSLCIKWWGCQWVCPPTLIDLMLSWFSNCFRGVEKCIWESIFFAVIWSIWKARNNLIFSNTQVEKLNLLDVIQRRVAFWVKAKCDLKEYSVMDFQRCIEGIRKIRRP